MSRKNSVKILVVASLLVIGFLVKIDYYIAMPSRAVKLSEVVSVADKDQDDQGSFFLLTVSQQQARLITAIVAVIHPHMNINQISRIIPESMTEEEYRELMRENMIESQHLAQVVALKKLGYDVDIRSDGVEVLALIENAPAEGILEEGDLIKAVDGNRVFLAPEVPMEIQNREVGEPVELLISRKGRDLIVNPVTGSNPEDPGLPYLGIYIRTLPWEPLLPVDIIINTGKIGGPSAGLMFTLEIMNQLLEDDITSGYRIAGTGTIDINGNVGRIGGIVQKVISAENEKADYFLVPESNYEQAKETAKKIVLVPVSTLEEAIDFLDSLEKAEN